MRGIFSSIEVKGNRRSKEQCHWVVKVGSEAPGQLFYTFRLIVSQLAPSVQALVKPQPKGE